MSETAETVVGDALGEIYSLGADQPIDASDMQLGIRYLNRMMARLSADGVSLGYTTVSTSQDVVTVPDAALDGVVYNLAVRLASPFGVDVSAGLAASAVAGMATLHKLGLNLQQTSYPSTLPVGSGNNRGSYGDRFFPGKQPAIATETNGVVLTEKNT